MSKNLIFCSPYSRPKFRASPFRSKNGNSLSGVIWFLETGLADPDDFWVNSKLWSLDGWFLRFGAAASNGFWDDVEGWALDGWFLASAIAVPNGVWIDGESW